MQDIEKSFGIVKALDHARLEVDEGEVHALIGANGAGKSTLMKVLYGELEYENGSITFNGKNIIPGKARDMRDLGIMMIRQEFNVIPILTVAQYLFFGREPTRGAVIDDRHISEQAAELLKPVGADFSPDARMCDLSVAQQQLVEIARAFSCPLKLLIMDEPTTALGERETERIFSVIRQLKARNVSVIYISHRLEELFTISDRITVMRDGNYITTLNTSATEKNELIPLLAGRDLETGRKAAGTVPADAPVVLKVENLSTASLLSNVSFSLRRGEILGLAGLMGSGRSEIVRAICGIDPKTSGTITINGKTVDIRTPKQAVEQGICYLSEDRKGEGIIPERSIIGNTVISSLDRYGKGPSLNDRRMLEDTVKYNERLHTKYSDPHEPVTSLSGGNAQKVIIARWLIRDCPIFIFDEPTKGIDVGSKDEIYKIIADIVKAGHSVILISSETEELLRNCDRLIVLCEGRVSGELPIQDATQEAIMRCATGGTAV